MRGAAVRCLAVPLHRRREFDVAVLLTGLILTARMFTLLRMYGEDNIASIYATSMHSDSGYLVTNGSVSSGQISAAQHFDR